MVHWERPKRPFLDPDRLSISESSGEICRCPNQQCSRKNSVEYRGHSSDPNAKGKCSEKQKMSRNRTVEAVAAENASERELILIISLITQSFQNQVPSTEMNSLASYFGPIACCSARPHQAVVGIAVEVVWATHRNSCEPECLSLTSR